MVEEIIIDKEQNKSIEQYNIDVSSYRTYSENLNSLEKKVESLKKNVGFFFWLLFFIIFNLLFKVHSFIDFITYFFGIACIAWFVSIFFSEFDFIHNIVSFGKLNRLKENIDIANKQKEIPYQKINKFETIVCDYWQNQLEEFYINNLFKKRSGNKLFEESLSEFSRLIDELSKINSSFIAKGIDLRGYKDYLSKRKIDHSFQSSKQSEELKSIHNLVKKVTESNEQKQKIMLPPEQIYRTAQRINDWEEINKKRRITGLKGEEIAVAMEQEFLIKINRKDLSNRVRHSSVEIGDSLGYDILSFFEDGREKYIEVKSTTTTIDSPYYLSRNELEFLKTHSENAFIYRFLVSNDIPQVKIYSSLEVLEMNQILPTQYIVQLKID
jgi:hypothetical protein